MELKKKWNDSNWVLFTFYFGFSFFLVTGLAVAASASTPISDEKFVGRDRIGRSLLQAKKACGVNFEFQNYTIITSQCKGPDYAPKRCCAAFKEFACPYVDQINDSSTDCSETMFSYITLSGNYPAGLFANECREGKPGLECPPTQSSKNKAGASRTLHIHTSLLLHGNAFLVLLLVFL